jgi:hypothetical protein
MKQMQLITKDIERKLEQHPLYSGDSLPRDEQEVIVKFFTPDSNWTWYVTEGQRRENGDWEFFGLVDGDCAELGYFCLSDFQDVKGPLGLYIERDRYYSGTLKDAFDASRRAY